MSEKRGNMPCPQCMGFFRVRDTRPSPDGGIRRRRHCEDCGYRATTYEVIGKHPPLEASHIRQEAQRLIRLATDIERISKSIGATLPEERAA